MQRLEVSGAVRLIYKSLGVKGLIFVSNQLDAQFFSYIYLLQFSTCFEQPIAHHQESQLYQYELWYMSLYVGDCMVWSSI